MFCETGSKTSQYKKLGKVKKEDQAVRGQSVYGCFCLLEVINKSFFLLFVGKEENGEKESYN